jgi:hypothetical protein
MPYNDKYINFSDELNSLTSKGSVRYKNKKIQIAKPAAIRK